MKKFLLLSLLLCSYFMGYRSSHSFAQTIVEESALQLKKNSTIRVYKINALQAQALITTSITYQNSSFFQNFIQEIDSVAQLQYLPIGHYITVFSSGIQLQYNYYCVTPYEVYALNNNTDFIIQIKHKQSNTIITNAIVKNNHQTIAFDHYTQCYSTFKKTTKGLLTIQIDNDTLYYNVKPEYTYIKNKNPKIRNTYNRYYNTVKFITALPKHSIKSIKRKRAYGSVYRIKKRYNIIHEKIEELLEARADKKETKQNKDLTDYYQSYSYSSKPIYKKNDTVKLKVLVLHNKNKKWLETALSARLWINGQKFMVGNCTPIKGSGYHYQFELHDSMKIQLDRNYTIQLLDKDTFIYAEASIRVEDYELQKSKFNIACNTTEQVKGQDLKITFTAQDENKLPMMDAVADITITTTSIDQVNNNHIFVPHQFWKQHYNITEGEKTIIIPDSIFSDMNMSYTIKAILKNGENERKESTFNINYKQQKFEIKGLIINDSLHIHTYQNDTLVTTPINVIALDNNDKIIDSFKGISTLVLPINTNIYKYAVNKIITDTTLDKFNKPCSILMNQIKPDINCYAYRTKDSIIINIEGKKCMPYVYHIYQANKEIQRGYGTDTAINLSFRSEDKDLYYVMLEYIWARETHNALYEIPLHNKIATLTVTQPEVIYPGKETEIIIKATDYKNNPIPNLNVWAYAYTAKFNTSSGTELPNFSDKQNTKPYVNSYTVNNTRLYNTAIPLNYHFWKEKLHIDTALAYQFLYPENTIKTVHFSVKNNITQMAPFVTDSGKLQEVYYVYIDHSPVYFGFTDYKLPYSFEATENKYYHIKIRTRNKLVTIESYKPLPHYKNVFSVDISKEMKGVTVIDMPDTFSNYERAILNSFTIKIDNWQSDNTNKTAYIRDYNKNGVIALNNSFSTRNGYTNLYRSLGPIAGDHYQFIMHEQYSLPLDAIGGFNYNMNAYFVDMRNTTCDKDWLSNSRIYCNIPALSDRVITEKDIINYEKIIPKLARRNISLYTDNSGQSTLQLDLAFLPKDSLNQVIQPLNLLLVKNKDYNFINIASGNTRVFNKLTPGVYNLIVVNDSNQYYTINNIEVKDSGINFYRFLEAQKLEHKNLNEFDALLQNLYYKPYNKHRNAASLILGGYLILNHTDKKNEITGVVLDKNNEPVIGAVVTLLHTKIAVQTDIEGNYSLTIPWALRKTDSISISSYEIGDTVLALTQNMTIKIYTTKNVEISEVRIYGSKIDKKSYTGSISTITAEDISRRPVTDIQKALEGTVPGVALTIANGQPGASPTIQIRGQSSLSASGNPLIVIDGAPYSGSLADLDPSLLESMTILKDASATSIYGSRASNGIVLIQTKKNTTLPTSVTSKLGKIEDLPPMIPQELMVSGMRNNFNDAAYWQPQLVTDKNGEVRFTVKFPDDLTAWNTYAYATNNQMYTGATSGNIRSFKPISAALVGTSFLVEGDSAVFLGKNVNYNNDTIPVTTTLKIDDSIVVTEQQNLNQFYNQNLKITAPPKDSIQLQYKLSKADGYFDGEERTIKIIPKGVLIAHGAFMPLDNKDTTFSIAANNPKDSLYLSATASLLHIVIDEIEKIKNYEHLCNEQLSSKIIAALQQEKLYQIKNWPLGKSHKKDIQKMIALLIERQNDNKLWGWWQQGRTEYWISQHVVKALLMAKNMHYDIGSISFENITEPLLYNWERDTSYTNLQSLQLMHSAGLKINYERYVKRMERKAYKSLGEQLALIQLRQQLGLPYNTQKVIQSIQEDIYGNYYWKDTLQYIYNNEMVNTLTAFDIIKNDTSLHINKHKIINWILQQRGVNGWRNIYEGSRIIETIASVIDINDSVGLKPSLSFTGAYNNTINTFPFETSMMASAPITVTKQGSTPVYFTWYQRQWDTTNIDLGKNFHIDAKFYNKNAPIQQLKAGTPIRYAIEVTVEKDAEYVMIEIPIPAGCSYTHKKQNYWGNEVHREYAKEKVSIFCQSMKKGKHVYEIELTPKFSGRYTLNPVKAELMYIPVIYGRNPMQHITIEPTEQP